MPTSLKQILEQARALSAEDRPYWKEERAKLARMDRLLSYKNSLRQRELR